MKIAVICPDRGDRPEFLEFFKKQIEKQTRKPDYLIIADWKPINNDCDITQRYRIAYNMVSQLDVDCILFMENDDYYATDYIERMLLAWEFRGKPDLFGLSYTYYYHLGLKQYKKFNHAERASMFCTLIKPNLSIDWCKDLEPYTDLFLWTKASLKSELFIPKTPIAIGIKHGIGMTGGNFHNDYLKYYDNWDENFDFLKSNCDPEAFNFYQSINKKLNERN